MTPRVSVVVTCCDLGEYLDEAVGSVLAQTVPVSEIVVVNDGSTDAATCRLLADYRRERTRVLHTERRGLPAARNAGARETTGEYLCMLDADDLLEPTYVERSLAALQADPELGFASHWLRAFGIDSWEWTPPRIALPGMLLVNPVNGAALMRRAMFDALGGFDETMTDGCEDWEFWIRAISAGWKGTIVPEFLYRYRQRADSMSRTMYRVPGAAALRRQLVERHPDLYAAHLDALLAVRDDEIRTVSSRLWRLESEWHTDLAVQLQWSEDNREDRLLVEREAGRDRVLEDAAAERARLAAEVRALRTSWSWRITAPLRAALGWVRR
ncbi:MAG TPA: glycosyltransferase family A protein [Vicinamibacterales bacterium]